MISLEIDRIVNERLTIHTKFKILPFFLSNQPYSPCTDLSFRFDRDGMINVTYALSIRLVAR
jgi:hypothetical protein